MSEQDHTHGPDCETVMAIRNTTIEEGVKLLTESNRKAEAEALEALLAFKVTAIDEHGSFKAVAVEDIMDRIPMLSTKLKEAQ